MRWKLTKWASDGDGSWRWGTISGGGVWLSMAVA
jgi:hypothetical protein